MDFQSIVVQLNLGSVYSWSQANTLISYKAAVLWSLPIYLESILFSSILVILLHTFYETLDVAFNVS